MFSLPLTWLHALSLLWWNLRCMLDWGSLPERDLLEEKARALVWLLKCIPRLLNEAFAGTQEILHKCWKNELILGSMTAIAKLTESTLGPTILLLRPLMPLKAASTSQTPPPEFTLFENFIQGLIFKFWMSGFKAFNLDEHFVGWKTGKLP